MAGKVFRDVMSVMHVEHISVSIDRRPAEVYAFASDPRNLPRWAAGLARSEVRQEGDEWTADSPMGKVEIRFAHTNPYGVLDHDVTLESGVTVHNPMRVVRNGDGSEVIFTLFRQPDMSDETLAEDRAAVEQDLQTLMEILERQPPDRHEAPVTDGAAAPIEIAMPKQLTAHPIHLGLGATAIVQPPFTGMEWYADYGTRTVSDGVDGRLVSMYTFDASWDSWEMHPNGAEVVLCTAGEITLVQQVDGNEKRINLAAGEYAINGPGVWHTAEVAGTATAVFITAGLGTEHRPRDC